MFFDLNERSMMEPTTPIFNNGVAGKVEGVKIEVKKRQADEPDNYPMYKIIYTDKQGYTTNEGFYHWTAKIGAQEEELKKSSQARIDRLLQITKSIVPEGYVYPQIEDKGSLEKTTNFAEDVIFDIIKDNSENKLVNLYVTYGTVDRPSRYLKPRFFDFIENPNTEKSRLVQKGNDMMEPVSADTPQNNDKNPNKKWI